MLWMKNLTWRERNIPILHSALIISERDFSLLLSAHSLFGREEEEKEEKEKEEEEEEEEEEEDEEEDEEEEEEAKI